METSMGAFYRVVWELLISLLEAQLWQSQRFVAHQSRELASPTRWPRTVTDRLSAAKETSPSWAQVKNTDQEGPWPVLVSFALLSLLNRCEWEYAVRGCVCLVQGVWCSHQALCGGTGMAPKGQKGICCSPHLLRWHCSVHVAFESWPGQARISSWQFSSWHSSQDC